MGDKTPESLSMDDYFDRLRSDHSPSILARSGRTNRCKPRSRLSTKCPPSAKSKKRLVFDDDNEIARKRKVMRPIDVFEFESLSADEDSKERKIRDVSIRVQSYQMTVLQSLLIEQDVTLDIASYENLMKRRKYNAWRTLICSRKISSGKFKVVEFGARDGLQNEKRIILSADNIELINRLSKSGLSTVEATSFVSPKWLPQRADHKDIISKISQFPGVSYPYLVPNVAGLRDAEIINDKVYYCKYSGQIFIYSDGRKLLKEKQQILADLQRKKCTDCVSCCPYDGNTEQKVVAEITERLIKAGCYEVSLGDTIGVGSAGSVRKMLDAVLSVAPPQKIAVHMHDTYGQALANVLVAIEKGIRVADSSIAGLGGCPYAKGVTGNLADDGNILNGLGFDKMFDQSSLISIDEFIHERLIISIIRSVVCEIKKRRETQQLICFYKKAYKDTK